MNIRGVFPRRISLDPRRTGGIATLVAVAVVLWMQWLPSQGMCVATDRVVDEAVHYCVSPDGDRQLLQEYAFGKAGKVASVLLALIIGRLLYRRLTNRA